MDTPAEKIARLQRQAQRGVDVGDKYIHVEATEVLWLTRYAIGKDAHHRRIAYEYNEMLKRYEPHNAIRDNPAVVPCGTDASFNE